MIRCVCGKKIGPDPRNFNQRVSLGRNDLLIRTFLSFIIENADMDIIERQKITTELWGSRSHFVNDANLTQILYLIRRDLKSLGINDLFITIPRQGIQVNKEIPIKAMESKKKENKRQVFRGFVE
ncbi:winged helix-turn-helix domain-containing protein [Klebsiella michiganensis]|uniref:winged helix-turn-helix domain-containing protein n=1 Tax=Klebsiella michiganensis TaxID=1134687 RepID=UPI002DB7C15B|nr:hypothetical protein [Klebsiella michiganensis]